MASGFYQALFLTQCGPTLNINLAFTCFYMPLNFVEFATKYLRKDITRGLSEGELQVFKRIVRNMLSKSRISHVFPRLISFLFFQLKHCIQVEIFVIVSVVLAYQRIKSCLFVVQVMMPVMHH